jgi:hypothetical protein
MKIKNVLSLAGLATVLIPVVSVHAVPLPASFDSFSNAPIGSDPVSGVVGSGSRKRGGGSSTVSLSPESQARLNAAGATLTASSLSGNQFVGGNTVNVNPDVAEVAIAIIDSPVGSDISEVSTMTAALGGGSAAQRLTSSMQGLRGRDGTINALVLGNAVRSYNEYLRYLIDSTQVTEKPSTELNSYIENLPPAQKVAQVVLGRLVEATR